MENAEPSGNSAAILNLLRLSQMTDNTKWDKIAGNSLAYFSNIINRYPDAMVFMLAAIDFSISKPKQIIIAGSLQDPLTAEILKLIRNHYIPNKIILLIDNPAEYEKFFPSVKNYIRLEGKTTVYVCENYNCKLPTSDLDEIKNLLMT
jgi:uncharacterized protein YyaL (SSP411 family)